MGSSLVGRNMPNSSAPWPGLPAGGYPPPSSPAPLSQAEGLSTCRPDANGQMASVPIGPGGTMASGL